MIPDDLMFEYPLIRRLNNKIRIMCETEQNKNSSHIAEGLKSVDIARDRFESCAKPFIFFCSVTLFFHWILSKSFCLRSEVPSRGLNGDGGNWSRWIRICHFYSPNTYPSNPLWGDILHNEDLFYLLFRSNSCLVCSESPSMESHHM